MLDRVCVRVRALTGVDGSLSFVAWFDASLAACMRRLATTLGVHRESAQPVVKIAPSMNNAVESEKVSLFYKHTFNTVSHLLVVLSKT